MLGLRRPRQRDAGTERLPASRPIMLATLEVPFDPAAAAFAVDAAVECGQPLLVVNVVEMPLAPLCTVMGYGDLDPPEDVAASLRAPAELAHALGVRVERLRVRSPHRLDALLQLAAERRPGLLVFGPARERMQPRAYRKAAKRVSERAACLVWLPE